MTRPPKLFGTAGIRGLYGKKVTADLVIKLSQTVVQKFPVSGIVVGHDARTSSESLAQFACASLATAGAQVYNVGLCSFPVIANLTTNNMHPLAIYITASHNPPEYNGIKILQQGREFTKEEQTILEEEINNIDEDNFVIIHQTWNKILAQKVIKDANLFYSRRIKDAINFKGDGRTLIVDCANGPMSLLSPSILSDMGFNVITINSHIDGSFPGRPGEPSKENLDLLIKLCKQEKVIGIAHDGDGDRVTLIDENGDYVELSRVNALLAKIVAKEVGTGKIILSIDSSTCIDQVLKKENIDVIRTSLGELHTEATQLIENGETIIFAAEPWKPIFPVNWGLWIDGLFGVIKILKELVENNLALKDIMIGIPKFYSERKSYIVEEHKAEDLYIKCKIKLKELVEDEEKQELTIDGLRYDFIDGTWILIRKSGTEPKIRIYYESPTEERFLWLTSIVEKVEQLLK
ncbi:MAG: hypothetical protein ACTSQE_04685 [Candidatus Heimdallarchaeaceae archaeon]